MSKKSEVIKLIAEITGKDTTAIKEEQLLKQDLKMDDMDLDDLFFRIEKKFGLTFSQSEMDKIKNVKTVIAYTDYYLAVRKK